MAAAVQAVKRRGALVERSCDGEALVRLAGTAPPLPGPVWDPAGEVEPVAGRPVVAVAGGPAFTFSYGVHVELLRAAGADVAVFDPLRDAALPDGTAALVIGGGFPEVHAAELAANAPMLASVAAGGGPVAAECAGRLYLCEELDGQAMCGLVPGRARMTPRLTLGYREAVAVGPSLLTRPGERFHGHEFHRTVLTGGGEPLFRWRDGGGTGADGFGSDRITASYLHLHWAGWPEAAQRLVSSSRAPAVLR